MLPLFVAICSGDRSWRALGTTSFFRFQARSGHINRAIQSGGKTFRRQIDGFVTNRG